MIRENFEEAKKITTDLDHVSKILFDLAHDYNNVCLDIYSDVFREDLIDFLTEEQKKLQSIFNRL